MDIEERRSIARDCRLLGYDDIAKYHEQKIREEEKKQAAK